MAERVSGQKVGRGGAGVRRVAVGVALASVAAAVPAASSWAGPGTPGGSHPRATTAAVRAAAEAVPAGAARFVPLAPRRLLDTREAGGALGAGETRELEVLGRGGVPTGGVAAVVVNLTATEAVAAGFVQALPAGQLPGGSSSLNLERPGQTVANLAVVPLGVGGRIALHAQSGAHLVVDVLGAFVASGPTAAGRYNAVEPARLLDTRTGLGAPPVAVAPGATVRVPLAGRGGLPAAGVAAVALNVTITGATGAGYVQVVPTDGETPLGASSNLNAVAGQTVANLAMVPVGADGSVTLMAQGGGHLLVDVVGWYGDATVAAGDGGLFVATDVRRLLDTRSGPRPGPEGRATVAAAAAGLPVDGVAALVGNVTATETAAPGFVQVLPGGAGAVGSSSTLNAEQAGQTLANAAVAGTADTGTFDLYTQSGTHLLFDVAGYFTAASGGGQGQPDPLPTTLPPTTAAPTTTPTTGTPTTATPTTVAPTTVAPTTVTPTTVAPTTTTPTTVAPTTTTTVPSTGGAVSVEGLDTFLGTGARLVFSTVAEQALPGRTIRVRNTSTSPIDITDITNPTHSYFRLVAGQARTATLAPGQALDVGVEFRPTRFSIITNATLTVRTSSPTTPQVVVLLSALDAYEFEGSSEPSLSQIVKTLGYTTDVGITGANQAKTRMPAGEEVVSQFWARAVSSRPTQLIPLARFVSRSETPDGYTAWKKATDGSTTKLYDFAGGDVTSFGGENQKLLPVPTGVTSFNPTTNFQLTMYFNEYSDDQLNGSTKEHNFRFYPARDHTGAVLADTWIVGHDKALGGKNYDYQDEVFLLVNARPAQDEAALPGAPALTNTFAGDAGGVPDRNRVGTGFAGTLANTGGTHADPSLLEVRPADGHLAVTSHVGSYSGSKNSQRNALFESFSAARGNFTVSAGLVGPFTHMSQPNQHQGIWVGYDQNNYFKFEVEYRNGAPHLVAFFEQGGSGTLAGTPVPLPAGVGQVRLAITGDLAAGQLQASYSLDGGAFVPFGTGVAPRNVLGFFARSARAGIVVSHENATASFVARYSDFTIQPV